MTRFHDLGQQPYAILENQADRILRDAERELAIPSSERRLRQLENGRVTSYDVVDGIATITIDGVIRHGATWFGLNPQVVEAQVLAAAEDEDVEGIFLDIHSPGGTVYGTASLGDAVALAASTKPVMAYAGNLVASAAYWIASAATGLFVGKTAHVGSIGVISGIVDIHRYYEQQGFDVTLIRSRPGKAPGTPGDKPRPEEAEAIKADVNKFFDLFVATVSEHRGLTGAALERVITGATWIGQEAVDLGLADKVSSRAEALRELRQWVGQDGEAASGPKTTFDAAVGAAASTGEGETVGEKNDTTPKSVQSIAELEAQYPELAKQLTLAAAKRGAEEERNRAARIREMALPGQEALVAKLIDGGASVEDACVQLLADAKQNPPKAATSAPQPLLQAATPDRVGQLFTEANAPVPKFGSTEQVTAPSNHSQANGSKPLEEDAARLVALFSEEDRKGAITKAAREEWVKREAALRVRYGGFDGYVGAMLGLAYELSGSELV
ncbi:MAG: S49 family peptidase [Planctomycetes bacterium]|nr:S49 family peptidase [Planctomycetota bacterium]